MSLPTKEMIVLAPVSGVPSSSVTVTFTVRSSWDLTQDEDNMQRKIVVSSGLMDLIRVQVRKFAVFGVLLLCGEVSKLLSDGNRL